MIVAGCLVERYRDDLIKELPEVDAFIGTSQVNEILKAADEKFDAAELTITPIGNKSATYLYDEYTPRLRRHNHILRLSRSPRAATGRALLFDTGDARELSLSTLWLDRRRGANACETRRQ